MSEYKSRQDRCDARKNEKLALAKTIQEEAAKLTPAEKLAKLDAKLGKDVGAKKERERLTKLLEKK